MCHRASASDREESAWVAAQEPPEPETTRLGHAECTSARFRADRRFCGECLRYVKWAVMCGLAAETLDASATCGRLKKHKDPNRQHRSFIGPCLVGGCRRPPRQKRSALCRDAHALSRPWPAR